MYDFDDYVKYVIDKDGNSRGYWVSMVAILGYFFGVFGLGCYELFIDEGLADWFLENIGEPSIVLLIWLFGLPIFYLFLTCPKKGVLTLVIH